MIRHIIGVAALSVSAALAFADATMSSVPVSPDISIIEAGVICPPETVGSSPAPDTIAGTTHLIEEEPEFVSNTRVVPAVLGLGFGVKAQTPIVGGINQVTMLVTHPAMGGQAVESQSFLTRISDLSPSLTFYQFDYSYELLPGTWTMTAMRVDQVLYQVEFEVVPPEMVPELAGVCGYLDLLS
ncbi:DUF3859 domain-containing protein [Cognatiyoonia sp. IB215182]|uniref:DUF3859 domain-containing protein n=1 Tax=Cognatiyoonia sp. IB215182 TaxID=3097353 RepID=UPI002A140FE5|nr:DUF3859 domain-containing protein [Cognatiyoonia sp. IB215182]MDX8354071.1 DUF3859 domain-containing protein [Cognatiyoonia sp. IB215182]